MNQTEFELDRQINPGQLDVEVVRQADLFFKWAERSIRARSQYEGIQLERQILVAGLQGKIRNDPEKYGVGKITEAAVDAAITLDEEVQAIDEKVTAARIDLQLLEAAVKTMDSKKKMLELLVTLHGQQYFAGPSVPRDLVSAWLEHEKKAEKKVNDKQREITRVKRTR